MHTPVDYLHDYREGALTNFLVISSGFLSLWRSPPSAPQRAEARLGAHTRRHEAARGEDGVRVHAIRYVWVDYLRARDSRRLLVEYNNIRWVGEGLCEPIDICGVM